MNMLSEVLIQLLLVFLCAGGLIAVALGIGMLFKLERISSLNQYFSRWIGTHTIKEQLDRPRWIERYFYRHHRLAGTFMLIGSVFILYVFMFSYNLHRFSSHLSADMRGLWIALTALLVIGGIVAAIVGMIVLVRPSLLRAIEAACNRWVSTEAMHGFVDRSRDSVDRAVLRHGKWAGLFMIVGGLYVLFVLGQLLLQGGWRL